MNNEETEKAFYILGKQAFLNNVELIKEYNNYKYNLFDLGYNEKQRREETAKYFYFKYGFEKKEIRLLENIVNAYYHRLRRCRAYIEYMFMNGKCFFLTLTFNNDVLQRTSEQTRRRYIQRYLNKHFDYYVANIDYGKKNEREHYHATVCLKNCNNNLIEIIKNSYDLGFSYFEAIKFNINDRTKVSKYMNKLTNHAFKDTAVSKRLIYSKNKMLFLPIALSPIIELDTTIKYNNDIDILDYDLNNNTNNEFYYKYILGTHF